MIIARAPYRISFFGGGTDYPAWYADHGGAVLSMTIDKYCHVLLRAMPPFLGAKYRIFWSEAEMVNDISDIRHPSVRGCLEYLGIEEGVEVNHAGDLPARSGLGSSSSFTAAMLLALHALRGEDVGRAELAKEAIAVEQDVLKETVGIQDQIAAAWGGFNVVRIERNGRYSVHPVMMPDDKRAELESWFVLCFTGLQRHASSIAKEQVENTPRNVDHLSRIAAMVDDGLNVLSEGTPAEFGELLHDSWMLKRQLSDKVTTDEIDRIYEKARSLGAIGGKVLGAGGGGFMLFCSPPERHREMLDGLGLMSIPVRLSHRGAEIVHRTA